MSDRPSTAPLGTALTAREREVIAAYRVHKTYRATGAALGISALTVKEHLANARSRRGVSRTWELLTDRAA